MAQGSQVVLPLYGATRYAGFMVALRVSRRTAFVAAAGWVAAPARGDLDGQAGGIDLPVSPPLPPVKSASQVFVLYRDLARFLRDPDRHRRRALRRALRSRQAAAALAVYGEGFEDYLLEQTSGLGAADAVWAMRADAAGVPEQVHSGLARARALLAADETPAVYLIFSRRFDGRTDGRAIFLGVDRFGTERLRDGVALLTAHEYNHIVRARAASFGTLLDGIIAEGLATACSELAEPGRPLEEYLLFGGAQLDWFTRERLALLWNDLAADAAAGDVARRRAYLDGAQAGPHGAPPRSGYYLGYLIVRAWLERGVPIATLTRMPAVDVWRGSGYVP